MFVDRNDAGRQLAARLDEVGVSPDVVLAIPRGGLPVGRAVADHFGVPLDVVVATKLGTPGNPELAVGAVAADGSVYYNEDVLAGFDVTESYLDAERERKRETAREKVEQYRGGDPLSDLDGKRVVVVDDGLATGATAIACLRQVRAAGATEVILAVPVAPVGIEADLGGEADRVVVVETPNRFVAVGGFYRDFDQVSDAEAVAYLDRGRGA